ncbi:MAG: GNAT family N-acetyltransferase [Lachnospiraceae bacterium]|jgi:GNAT superfamily N-acetyltransferase|nr:hypothetical protein C819_03578 [Lachnospiraceae bacterium 10-1]MCX4352489.1 GNAT family N-acetyltransferase [Lachnospiraceae bacterium]
MEQELPYEIRFAGREEWEEAMGLAWKTFLEFEADDYSLEGIRSFEDFITDSGLKRMFDMGTYQMISAYDRKKMIGMITLRNEMHISLLFVDRNYHRQGVGKALIGRMADYARTELGQDRLTVNASPYGVGFYHKIGFKDLGPEKKQDGIIYTPMHYKLQA